MKKISIYTKDNSGKREEIAQKFKRNGFHTSRNGEIVVVVGGDGTYLSAAKKRFEDDPIFVGLNSGNLGFLSEFSVDEADQLVKVIKNGDYWVEELPVYEVKFRDKTELRTEYFINDVVIERKGTNVLHMGLQVNGKTLGTVSADALIVSSSLGSTAYNMSAKGAVAVGNLPIMQIASVASLFSKSYRSPLLNPLLVPESSEITIFPTVIKQRAFRLVCDGRDIKLKNARFVEISKSAKVIKVLRSNKFNSIDHLKDKLLDVE